MSAVSGEDVVERGIDPGGHVVPGLRAVDALVVVHAVTDGGRRDEPLVEPGLGPAFCDPIGLLAEALVVHRLGTQFCRDCLCGPARSPQIRGVHLHGLPGCNQCAQPCGNERRLSAAPIGQLGVVPSADDTGQMVLGLRMRDDVKRPHRFDNC